jgi:2-C-methyl-D-erythritol 4-phosphate cytidylyltransferase
VTGSSRNSGEAGGADATGFAGKAGGTWAILVAAGSGSRLGGERPKAFVGLGGRPLLAESLERLDASDWIDAIVVVSAPGWEEPAILLAEELVASKVTAVVAGGATRAESVRTALAEVPADALVVLVHDAARPLVDDAVIERLLGRLGEGLDGVVPGLPLADTVKRVAGGIVAETLDRDSLVTVQTPQAFVADRLRAAYARELAGATDCASLVERDGGRIGVVDGDPRLVKITTRDDLAHVSRLLGGD